MDKKTFTAYYKCRNCSKLFNKQIKKGHIALGNGGLCPFCGTGENIKDAPRIHLLYDIKQ